MSNYITVRNGLLKREIPNTPVVVEFTNDKGLKYITTLENGRARETVEFFGIPVVGSTEFYSEGFDLARERDIEVIHNRSVIPYYGGITSEQIREAVDYVFNQRVVPVEEQPLSQLRVTSNPVVDGDNWTYNVQVYPLTLDECFTSLPDSVTRVEDMSADEALRRGIITNIEYLDIISREDDNI